MILDAFKLTKWYVLDNWYVSKNNKLLYHRCKNANLHRVSSIDTRCPYCSTSIPKIILMKFKFMTSRL